MYNSRIAQFNAAHPYIRHNFLPLSTDEINNIPVNQKVQYHPFSMYWEFLCPSNNTTLMNFVPDTNPFLNYEFDKEVPNPTFRREAAKDARYKEKYPPRQQRNQMK